MTHGDLYHGNMRFDVNISVAKKGASELGKRAEIKNLNSFRSVEKAAEYEFKRQVDTLERGEAVVQETRGWSDDTGKTSPQRSKEDAQDYRYMPDADIPPIVLTDEEIEEVQKKVGPLPPEYRKNWQPLGLDISVINSALNHQPVAITLDSVYCLTQHNKQQVFDELGVDETKYVKLVKRVFNWFASTPDELMDIEKVAVGLVGPRRLTQLALLAEDGKISSTSAKQLFIDLFDDTYVGKMPEEMAKAKNLIQNSDEGAIAQIVDEVLADPASAKAVADIKAGNEKAIGFLVGSVMKKSKGQANPGIAQKLIKDKLSNG
ncbi:MAG: hypothetical protein CR979_02365 [Propionibacterium sp.]|nr:MAG: hypothetical protein CR979_02365 [Propionibacterium sp.]